MPCLLVISGFQQHTVTRAHLIIIQEEFQGIKPHLPRALASPRSVHKAVSGRHTDVLRCLLFLSLPHTLLEASSSCRNCPLSALLLSSGEQRPAPIVQPIQTIILLKTGIAAPHWFSTPPLALMGVLQRWGILILGVCKEYLEIISASCFWVWWTQSTCLPE